MYHFQPHEGEDKELGGGLLNRLLGDFTKGITFVWQPVMCLLLTLRAGTAEQSTNFTCPPTLPPSTDYCVTYCLSRTHDLLIWAIVTFQQSIELSD